MLIVSSYQFFLFEECPFDNSNNYQRQLNHFSRISYLLHSFQEIYYFLITGECTKATESFFLKNGEHQADVNKIEAFLKKINDPEFDKKISNVKIKRVLTPEMIENLDVNAWSELEYTLKKYVDCNDINSFAIELDFDGKEYYLFVDVGCFDGVWYNLSVKSLLGIYLTDGSTPFSISYR